MYPSPLLHTDKCGAERKDSSFQRFGLRHQGEGRLSARPGPSSRGCSDSLQTGLQSESSWPLRPCPPAHASSWGAPGSQLRPQFNQRPTVSGSQSRHNLQRRCPSTEECGRARLVPRPSSPPGGAGPRAGEGGRRAGCVASTPAWEYPCLNLNTFILTANKQRTVFWRLSQSCRLSPLGPRGLAALPFLPSC